MATATNYLQPDVPASLPGHKSKLIKATPDSLKGYGLLVDDYKNYPLEIVTWPKPAGRPIDDAPAMRQALKAASSSFGGREIFSTEKTVR